MHGHGVNPCRKRHDYMVFVSCGLLERGGLERERM
jgi:hypothetical protein